MPWQEATPMQQRERFVRDHQRALYTMTELCVRYGISRKTGYKWLDRFDEGGRSALRDRSRAPHQCPHAMSHQVAQLICDARQAHPSWGTDQIVGLAGTATSRARVPSAEHRRRSSRAPKVGEETPPATGRSASGRGPATTQQPNDLWTADFKGHVRTGNGVYCYPLSPICTPGFSLAVR